MNSVKLSERFGREKSFLITGLAMILLFAFTSCSTSTESTSYISDDDGKEKFSFTETIKGEESQFTAHFDGDRITSIYKDGGKVPADKMDEYSELVYHKLNNLRKGMKDFDDDMVHFFCENNSS